MRSVTKPEEFDHYRTTKELADWLGVHHKTVRRWMMDRKISASVRGDNGILLWSPDDCDRAMEYRRSQLPSSRATDRRIN